MAKKVLPKFAMFGTGADMSAASTTSASTQVENIDNIGIDLAWTGSSPVGTVVVNHSDDNVIWFAYDFGSAISISGSTGSHSISINQQPFMYIQVVYTKTSGTGTLLATIAGKEV